MSSDFKDHVTRYIESDNQPEPTFSYVSTCKECSTQVVIEENTISCPTCQWAISVS